MPEYGPELVSNGAFDTASGWTFGAPPWSYHPTFKLAQAYPGNGLGTGRLSQSLSLMPGATYEVAYKCYQGGTGTIRGFLGGTEFVIEPVFSLPQTDPKTVDVVAGANGLIEIEATIADSEDAFWFDNVSVRRKFDGGDYYHVYRGQDGVIDYETPIAVMGLEAVQIQIPQDLPPNTIWHYVRRQVRGDSCGLEGESSDPCIVYIDADGNMRPAAPNPPTDMIAEPIAGGKIRLRWRYSAAGQEVAPDGFAIFQSTSNVFGDTPRAIVASGIALNNVFKWDSDVLAEGVYYFMIKGYNNLSGGVGQPSRIVTASPDSSGPPAIANMIAETESE